MSPSSTTSSEAAPRCRKGDELIAIAPIRTPAERRRAWIVIGVFAAFTAGIGILDLVRLRPRPALVGIELQYENARRAAAKFADGSLFSLLERDLRTRSFSRAKTNPGYAASLYRWFGETTRSIICGRDGYLFLRDRLSFIQKSSPVEIASRAARIARLASALGRRGTRLVVVPVPDKAVALPSYLPRGVTVSPEPYRTLVRELEARRVPVVDLLAAFASTLGHEAYLPHDTHWSPRAIMIAAEAMCRTAGILAPEAARKTTVQAHPPQPYVADLLRSTGMMASPTEGAMSILRPFSVLTVHDESGRRIFRDHDRPEMELIAISGTSFTHIFGLLPAAIEHSSQRVPWYFAHRAGSPIDSLRFALERASRTRFPEVLFWEIPEHFVVGLPNFGNGLDELLGMFSNDAGTSLGTMLGLESPAVFADGTLRPGRSTVDGVVQTWSRPGLVVAEPAASLDLRLRGRAEGGALLAVAYAGGKSSGTTIAAGDFDLALPYTPPSVADSFGVSMKATGRAVSLDLRTLDLEIPVAFRATATVSSTNTPTNGSAGAPALHFAQPVSISRDAIAILRVGPIPAGATRVSIEIVDASGESSHKMIPLRSSVPDALLLVSLSSVSLPVASFRLSFPDGAAVALDSVTIFDLVP